MAKDAVGVEQPSSAHASHRRSRARSRSWLSIDAKIEERRGTAGAHGVTSPAALLFRQLQEPSLTEDRSCARAAGFKPIELMARN